MFIGPDRRGSGVLYNIMPLEADANAVAARFMRARLGDVRADALADSAEGVLFRRQRAPGPPSTAGVRTVCFAALGAARAERWLAGLPGGPRALLDAVAGDPDLWDALREDGELTLRIAAASEVIPETAALDATCGNFLLAWAPLRVAVLHAYTRALEVAGIEE